MSEIEQMWIPPKPLTKNKVKSPFTSVVFFGFLFFAIATVALAAVYLMPQINPAIQMLTEPVQVTDLMPNCAYFYQLCPTSNEGVVTLQTVDTLLTRLNSPLQQAGPLLHPETDSEQSTIEPPSQILTLIGAKYDINPFLILTLSEMNSHLVTQQVELKPVIESAGEQAGDAWFSIQHQNIAIKLQQYAENAHLTTLNLKENSRLKTVQAGTQTVELTGTFSLATQVIIEYLAANSTSSEDLQTKLNTFKETYARLWGFDPSTTFPTDQ